MESLLKHLTDTLPHSAGDYGLEIVVGMSIAMLFGSFFEYFIHKHVMHRGLPFLQKKRYFDQQYKSHAILHHATYYKKFDHEDDPLGKEESIIFTKEEIISIQIALLPALIFIGWFSPVTAICFSVVAFAHNNLWNIIHREMHQPQKPSWSRTALYRFLARHHFLHHRNTNKNYNVVFPFADFILNTYAVATVADKDEISSLGY